MLACFAGGNGNLRPGLPISASPLGFPVKTGLTADLLEREDELETLAALLGEATAGQGRIALISGEAGIGKTSFVDHFLATHAQGIRILKGNCDALFTPSPLGPLYDIARQIGGKLQAELEGEVCRAAVFSTMLDQLRDPAAPTLLVFEDIHWADEATIDLIKFLTRRMVQTNALLILTYRDDELGAQHPLRMLLGDLATCRATIRIELPRLTIDAVRILIADRPFDPDALHGQTSGNPFFIAEVLSHAGRGIPRSVRDAVLARVAKLTPAGRQCPGGRRGDRQPDGRRPAGKNPRRRHRRPGRLHEGGTARGGSGNGIGFRHELVREAVLTELDPGRHRELSRSALAGLKACGRGSGDLAQLAHFAEGAGDGAAVVEFGAAAARAAASVGAHRSAAAQYRRVLDFAGDRSPAERARLFETYAEECAIIDELAEASRARREATQLWRQAGDRLKEGENLAALAWPLVRSGQNAAAEEASRAAIEVLESLPPSRQLAAAYRIQAHLRMLDRDRPLALRWGKKAIELATRFQDHATIAAAEIVVGSAMLASGDDKGRARLDRSLAIAREAGADDLIGLAHLNLGSSYGEQYRFGEAERHLAEGLAYSGDCDLDHAAHYMRAWLALTRLYQGRWREAGEIATSLLARPHVAAISRIMALVALGRLHARRGDPGAAAALDEALDLALQTDTLQRLAPARAARAEAACLAGDPSAPWRRRRPSMSSPSAIVTAGMPASSASGAGGPARRSPHPDGPHLPSVFRSRGIGGARRAHGRPWAVPMSRRAHWPMAMRRRNWLLSISSTGWGPHPRPRRCARECAARGCAGFRAAPEPPRGRTDSG